MTDAELQTAIDHALHMAHTAPLAAYRLDHDGHRWIEQTPGWSKWSLEWVRLRDEQDRRRAQSKELCGNG